jgi:hypothetical protein
MKTFGELTQIELDETIAKNEYESRLVVKALRAARIHDEKDLIGGGL